LKWRPAPGLFTLLEFFYLSKVKIFRLLFLSIIFFNAAYGQPAIEWQNTIGGTERDDLEAILQTADKGYVLGGISQSDISGDKTEDSYGFGSRDYWVLKTDSTGNIEWQNTIGGDQDEYLKVVLSTMDGGYLLCGYSKSDSSRDKHEYNFDNTLSTFDYWIVKISAGGSIAWENTIGGTGDDALTAAKETADSGFILLGWSNSTISGDKTEDTLGNTDGWLVRIGSTGNILWQNTIGGSGADKFFQVCATDDGFLIGGASASDSSGDKTENSKGGYDFWLLRLDTAGNVTWQKTIGGAGDDALLSIQETPDSGYFLAGYSNSGISGDKTENSVGGHDYWVLKADQFGNILWQNTIGGSADEIFSAGLQTADSGYILGGFSNSNSSGDKSENNLGGNDYWVVKLDSTGNVQWENTIGGSAWDLLTDIIQSADGGYVLGGYSGSDASGDKSENNWGIAYDYWLVKLLPDSLATQTDFMMHADGIFVYPNPTMGKFKMQNAKCKIENITVYNLLGEKVLAVPLQTPHSEPRTELDISSLPPGIYILQATGNEKSWHTKVVKQ
jgi:hypothetical protein